MDFTTIGTLHSYLQQKNLKFAADYKKKTGQTITDGSGRLKLNLDPPAGTQSLVEKMMKAQQQDNSEYAKQRISSIKQKLMNGKKISNEEMGYLRKNDPDLYKKAKKAEESREELSAALKRAKTKDEARKAVTQAMIKASAEATAELAAAKAAANGGGGGNVPAGYQAGTEVGGPNAEAISANAAEAEPAMVRLNEQINAKGEEITAAEVNEIDTAKEVGSDLKAANEAVAEANSAEVQEAINEKSDSTNESSPLSENKKDTPQDIMEKFIMVIRALEDEWKTFANSKEYKELAEDAIQDAKIDAHGKHKRRKTHGIDKPDQQVMDIISTYRNAMLYSQTQSTVTTE